MLDHYLFRWGASSQCLEGWNDSREQLLLLQTSRRVNQPGRRRRAEARQTLQKRHLCLDISMLDTNNLISNQLQAFRKFKIKQMLFKQNLPHPRTMKTPCDGGE